jgi:Flp pilus assembly protein TadG
MKSHLIRRDEGGAAIIEFALSVPILVTMIYGIFELSQLFEANAGMQHALGEGARYATLCIPTSTGCNTETNDDIKAKMNAKLFGPIGGTFNVQDPVDDASTNFKTLTITYRRTMNFLTFVGPTVTLTRKKVVYTPAAA